MPRAEDFRADSPELDDPADDTAAHNTLEATEEPAPRTESNFAAAASRDDDEDVSLDELMMSDSADDEEEEEATDIHPGLSEDALAESLAAESRPGVPRAPAVVAGRPAVAVPVVEEPEAPVEDSERSAVEVPAIEGEPIEDAALEDAAIDDEVIDPAPVSEQHPGEGAAFPAAGALAEEQDPEEIVIASDDVPAEQAAALADGEAAPASDPDAAHADGVLADLVPGAPAHEEPTRPDASPLDSDIIEVSPESESDVLSSAAMDAVALESEQLGDDEALELEPSVGAAQELAASAAERKTVPETLRAKRRDAPLPSFDIPDLEAVSGRQMPAAPPAEAPPRPPARPVALPPLAEVGEDDDDAVTHMGLPTVPEAANDYPAAANGFQVADPAIAALQSIDADIARGDSRRATTRVIPRVDPKTLPPKPRAPAGPLAERLGAVARDAWALASRYLRPDGAGPAHGGEGSGIRPRVNWMLENVLPPLSLVLFGSGLGAGVIMLVEKDRPEEAAQTQSVQALHDAAAAPRAPTTLAERARAGDGEALYKITKMPQGERTSALTLALETGYQAQKLREFHEFAKTLAPASKPLPAASLSRMVDYTISPETMLPAFEELTQWAGPAGPDVLYAVWEKAGGGSRAASLAQQLLYSADQRAKATPALQVALDLRSAASCDDYAKVLPSVLKSGDQRSTATLRALRHNDGCGADGKQDCYACLRGSTLLEDALRAVEKR
ncbi:MAG TPA: hypothetical protein VFS67_14190 [Polyangiaceae bacterium]|nr:hypothetical protein [Polyangiaceae bacterium]